MPTTMAAGTDLETRQELNREYIRSVQESGVRRFDEILAPDFVCTNPDGTFLDRAAFLVQTARPVTISGLEARDVVIRIMGDVALIHARRRTRSRTGRRVAVATPTCGRAGTAAGSPGAAHVTREMGGPRRAPQAPRAAARGEAAGLRECRRSGA